jgi:hypothetical protein
MVRPHLVAFLVFAPLLSLLFWGCSSSSSSSVPSSDAGAPACPSVAGTWKVATHCDASLVGQSAVITQTGCALTFAPPFDKFTGTVASDGKLTLSGPQSCVGTAGANSISMSCTPGTCSVTLTR